MIQQTSPVLSSDYEPGVILELKEAAINKSHQIPAFMIGRQTLTSRKQMNKITSSGNKYHKENPKCGIQGSTCKRWSRKASEWRGDRL